MEKAKVLENLIKENGYSIRSFAQKCNMPESTLYTILKKGVGRASVDNIASICKNLNITIESLDNLAIGTDVIRPIAFTTMGQIIPYPELVYDIEPLTSLYANNPNFYQRIFTYFELSSMLTKIRKQRQEKQQEIDSLTEEYDLIKRHLDNLDIENIVSTLKKNNISIPYERTDTSVPAYNSASDTEE